MQATATPTSNQPLSTPRLLKSLRAVAVFEAVKGVLVLAVGCCLLGLLHQDAHSIALEFVSSIHLDPAAKYPKIFIDLTNQVTDAKLWFFAGLALVYALFRFIEGYGLWKERAWAEWLALVSGSIYLPIEIYELYAQFSWAMVAALLANIGVVGLVAYALFRKRVPLNNGSPT
ncbi:MAG: DUF2127 domain-containing protein [Verrucomicrobia bacterium]|nr:MAG: DUF2127 domain-containing protein [Verrucomicrobiota bacterium]